MSADDSMTEAAVVADLAISTATPFDLDPDILQGVVVPLSGEFEVIDLEFHREHPRRAKGTVTLHDGKSFAAYVNKHRIPLVTELYADTARQTVVAVINDDGPAVTRDGSTLESGVPGWRDHRAVLNLRHTKEWDTWQEIDGKMLEQVAFAEFIESNATDIVEPDAATMLELAQTFEAKKGVEFKSSKLLDSGQRQLLYHEQQTASAGANGTIEIPKELVLGIAPFEIGQPYRVSARFRYRLIDGDLRLGIKFDRVADILKSAFDDVINEIKEMTDLDVLYGVPAS